MDKKTAYYAVGGVSLLIIIIVVAFLVLSKPKKDDNNNSTGSQDQQNQQGGGSSSGSNLNVNINTPTGGGGITPQEPEIFPKSIKIDFIAPRNHNGNVSDYNVLEIRLPTGSQKNFKVGQEIQLEHPNYQPKEKKYQIIQVAEPGYIMVSQKFTDVGETDSAGIPIDRSTGFVLYK